MLLAYSEPQNDFPFTQRFPLGGEAGMSVIFDDKIAIIKFMFCPNCGKADQKENSYCRQCGEFLPDFSQKNKLAFGGNTPEDQIRINLVLNLMSAIVSFVLAIILFATFGFFSPQAPPIIYLVIAFLFAMSTWQISTFVVGLKLKKHFKKGRETAAAPEPDKQFQAAETRELLNEADPSDAVPIGSVTENTTTKLKMRNKGRK